jgi:hypothetical protein
MTASRDSPYVSSFFRLVLKTASLARSDDVFARRGTADGPRTRNSHDELLKINVPSPCTRPILRFSNNGYYSLNSQKTE